MKRHALYPEPGAWVLGKTSGLPEIQPPEQPVKAQLSVEQVADMVEYHGLGVCIYSYVFAKKIKNKELRRRWLIARKALVAVVDILEKDPPKTTVKARRLDHGREL